MKAEHAGIMETESNVEFRSIEAFWKEGMLHFNGVCSDTECSQRHDMGFKLMCRFYALQLMPMLYAEGYEFVMRIDDDGELRSPINIDLFGFLYQNQYVYAFRNIHLGKHGDVELSLAAFTTKYIADHEITPKCALADLTFCVHFANSFFVGSSSFFVRPDVAAFMEAVDQSNGFARHGWGDSLVIATAIKIFATPNEIVQLLGLDYFHGSHNQHFVPGVGDWTFRSFALTSSGADVNLSGYFCDIQISLLDLSSASSCNAPFATLPPHVCQGALKQSTGTIELGLVQPTSTPPQRPAGGIYGAMALETHRKCQNADHKEQVACIRRYSLKG